MSGDILIVDSIASNRIGLKVKLSSAFGTLSHAHSAEDALAAISLNKPDIVLANPGMNDMRFKAFIDTVHAKTGCQSLPIVAITSETAAPSRLRLLGEGALDVISLPVEDVILHARLRAILRDMQRPSDMWLQPATAEVLGFAEQSALFEHTGQVVAFCPSRVLNRTRRDNACRYRAFFADVAKRSPHRFKCYDFESSRALRDLSSAPDAVFLGLHHATGEPDLASLAALRASPQTRDAKIIALLDNINTSLSATVLDMGANDVLDYHTDLAEVDWRLNQQINRKFEDDRWKAGIKNGLNASVRDPLTGLYNRRFAMSQLERIAVETEQNKASMAVLLADLDHFKSVNDRYGHAAGDKVLAQLANLISEELRQEEIGARIGGEEFLIILPDTSAARAPSLANRLRRRIRQTRISLDDNEQSIGVTASFGVVMVDGTETRSRIKPDILFKDADKALYGSKSGGRDTVTLYPRSAA